MELLPRLGFQDQPHQPGRFADRIPLSSAADFDGEAWLGITVAYYTDWPVSFRIAVLAGLNSLGAL